MTEIQNKCSFSDLLKNLKDCHLNKKNYSALLLHLELEDELNSSVLQKLTELCLQEYNKKNSFSVSSLKILSCLLQKVKKNQSCPSGFVELLGGALHTLQTNVSSIHSLRTLCFEILMLFPDESLIKAALVYSKEIYTIIDLYCQEASPELVLQSLTLALKLLQILPAPNKRTYFVKCGLNKWFSSVLPTIFNVAKHESQGLTTALNLLEVLTQELLQCNYFENKHWKLFYANISSHYVPIILHILQNGHVHWSKLWVACVKLMKSRVTSNTLDDLLAVEENAFKMNSEMRCVAFQCWNDLINSFTLQNRRFINTNRIECLTLPLLSYNAKSEAIALAKFGTWWHLITKLYNNGDFLTNYLHQFLMFCFGQPQPSDPLVPAGMLSSHTKKLVVQAFTNILGHYDCTCCVELEKINEYYNITAADILKNKIIWFHSLSTVIEICVESEDEEIRKQLECAWKSLIVKFCELSHDILRKEPIFSQILLSVLEISQQKCCFGASNLIINTLIPVLFEIDKDKLTALVVNDSGVLDKIQETLSDASHNYFYLRCDIDETLRNIRRYTDYVISNRRDEQSLKLEHVMEKLPSSISGLVLWTAYVETIIKFKYICSRSIINTVLWPIQHNIASNLQKFTQTWIDLYDFLDSENIKVIHTINNKIVLFLSGNKSVHTTLNLTSIVLLIKQNFKKRGGTLKKKKSLFVKLLTKQINDEYLTPTVYLHLLECLELLIDLFKVHKDIRCVKKILIISNTTLKITPKIISENKHKNTKLIEELEKFLKFLMNLIKIEEYSKFNSVIGDGIKKIASYFAEIPQLSILIKHILPILSTYDDKDKDSKELLGKISPEVIAKDTLNKSKDQFIASTKTATPTKSIVNNVDKEKLQRKREGIPAVYQILSQSQDEFKLRNWKTDSNDTTSSSKSSNVTATKHNIRNNAQVFPKIVFENVVNKKTNLKLHLKVAKKTKYATKGRVSRNVQNLKEKSILAKHSISPCLVVCKKLSLPKTATRINVGTIDADIVITPAANSSVQPMRKTKTPRKYTDTTFGIKEKVYRKLSQDDVSQDSTEKSDTMPKNVSDSDKLLKKTESIVVSIQDNLQRNNNNASTDTPKINRNRHTRKMERLQKRLYIDMVDSPLLTCTRIDDHAKRNKISSAATTTKLIESEYVKVTNSSPNSELSLKKRSQVRSSGRGAQMLGLCVPEASTCSLEKRSEESNRTTKRNLQSLYNNTDADSSNYTDKHAEMCEGTSPSPTSKKKCVSFHDPPASMTAYVKKNIGRREFCSPRSSRHKRQRRLEMAIQSPKSPTRLDNILAKTVDSLLETENTEDALSSLDTSVVEVVHSSNLDNIDPICPHLTACEDPIENIVAELSSPAMKTLLVKEFEGKIITVSDLARLTELEVNRLCIKAPKVDVAKKVLQGYWKRLNKGVNLEFPPKGFSFIQTDNMEIAHQNVQTETSGDVVQEDDIPQCLSKKPDIMNTLDRKAFEAVNRTLVNRLEEEDWCKMLDTKLGQSSSNNKERVEFICQLLREQCNAKDLISIGSELLKKKND